MFRIFSIPSKVFLFSSARSRDFDEMLGTGLTVSMYATKTSIDMWHFNIPQLKEFLTFSVNDRYQLNYVICIKDFNCVDNYFFKIEIVFFLYLLQSASWKENDLSWYISVIRQTVRYRTPAFTQPFSWRLHITITYNLSRLPLWYVDIVCQTFQTGHGRNWHDSKQPYWNMITIIMAPDILLNVGIKKDYVMIIQTFKDMNDWYLLKHSAKSNNWSLFSWSEYFLSISSFVFYLKQTKYYKSLQYTFVVLKWQ